MGGWKYSEVGLVETAWSVGLLLTLAYPLVLSWVKFNGTNTCSRKKIKGNPLLRKRMCNWTWSQTQVACILQGGTRGKGIWTKQRVAETDFLIEF